MRSYRIDESDHGVHTVHNDPETEHHSTPAVLEFQPILGHISEHDHDHHDHDNHHDHHDDHHDDDQSSR